MAVSIIPSEDSTAVDTVECNSLFNNTAAVAIRTFLLLQTIAPSDYDPQDVQVIFTPGGPNEMTIQLQVNNDATLEANEILLLSLSLSPAAVESGGRLGPRNKTIINDDSKLNYYNKLLCIYQFLMVFQLSRSGFSQRRHL